MKTVILKDNVVFSRGKAFSGFDPKVAAEQSVGVALKSVNLRLADVGHFVATGSSMELAPSLIVK